MLGLIQRQHNAPRAYKHLWNFLKAHIRYIKPIELKSNFPMVFILSQLNIYWEIYGILKFLVYKNSKYLSYSLDILRYYIILIWLQKIINTMCAMQKVI